MERHRLSTLERRLRVGTELCGTLDSPKCAPRKRKREHAGTCFQEKKIGRARRDEKHLNAPDLARHLAIKTANPRGLEDGARPESKVWPKLDQRRRRWSNIDQTLDPRRVRIAQ